MSDPVEEARKREASKFRDDDGRYTFSDMTQLCACGHSLGVHASAGTRDCMNDDVGDGAPCDCEKFRKSRRKRK